MCCEWNSRVAGDVLIGINGSKWGVNDICRYSWHKVIKKHYVPFRISILQWLGRSWWITVSSYTYLLSSKSFVFSGTYSQVCNCSIPQIITSTLQELFCLIFLIFFLMLLTLQKLLHRFSSPRIARTSFSSLFSFVWNATINQPCAFVDSCHSSFSGV